MARLACKVCYATDFSVVDGLTYCNVCGTQRQDVGMEEEAEFQVGIDDQRHRRRAYRERGRRKNAVVEEEAVDDPGSRQQQVIAYVACLQTALQDGSATLERVLGCPGFGSTCKRLWLALVASSGVLEPDWGAPEAEEAADLAAEKEEGEAEAAEGGEEPKKSAKKKKAPKREVALSKLLSRRLPPAVLPALCLLAAQHHRLPLLPTDLIAWGERGRLPFASFERLLEPLALDHAPELTRAMNRAARKLTPDTLCTLTASLAASLGLSPPPAALEPLVARLTQAAGLPPSIAAPAIAALEALFGPEARLQENTTRTSPGAATPAAASIVAALRLLNPPLHFRGMPEGAGTSADWALASGAQGEVQAMHMEREGAEAYLRAIRSEALFSLGAAPVLEGLMKALGDVAVSESGAGTEPGGSGAQPQPRQRLGTPALASTSGSPDSTPWVYRPLQRQKLLQERASNEHLLLALQGMAGALGKSEMALLMDIAKLEKDYVAGLGTGD